MQPLSPLKRSSTKQDRQGLHFTLRGDPELLRFLTLKIQLTIIVDKPFVTSVPLLPILSTAPLPFQTSILEPLLAVEVIGEMEKQYILRNKMQWRENTMYVYFPANVRVNDTVNVILRKMYNVSYQNLVKELPKNIKNCFCKLIIYEQGTGQQSIDHQKTKCSDLLSTMVKARLQRKIQQLVLDIDNVHHSEINIKGLFTIFKAKYGLAYLYRRIGVSEKAKQVLELLWQDMIFNQRFYTNSSAVVLMLPPFIEHSYTKIVKDFFTSSAFLKICAFCFLKSYELDLQLMNYCDALRTMKKFIEVSWANLTLSTRSKDQQTVLKNMWVLSLIDQCNSIASKLGRLYPTFLNTQKQQEYHGLAISLARTYKVALEVVGKMYYGFNPQDNYPSNLEKQVGLCLEYLKKNQEERVEMRYESDRCKLIANTVGQNFLLLFGGVDAFKILYLKGLVNFYEIMSRSTNYLRMARSLKLLVLKAYLSTAKPARLSIPQIYIKQYGSQGVDLQQYMTQIMLKAQKLVIFQDEDFEMHAALYKKTVRYSLSSDNFINRLREDETLWADLKFIEDFYKFIVLLQTYREEHQLEEEENNSNSKQRKSFSLNFSSRMHAKVPIKSDNIIHLLLNEGLMGLREMWEESVKLVREIFRLQKGESENTEVTTVRLGIMIQASIQTTTNGTILLIRVNNQQLLNLSKTPPPTTLIHLSALILDLNHILHTIPLTLHSIRLTTQSQLQLQFIMTYEQTLIFIIKELQIKIGPILCYYTNKNIEQQELKQLEENASPSSKKRGRKYSFLQEKLKEEQFVLMMISANAKSQHLAMAHLYYRTFSVQLQKERPTRQSILLSRSRTSSLVRSRNNSGANRSSRSNRSQSMASMSITDSPPDLVLSKGLWNPVPFKITANYSSKQYRVELLLGEMVVGVSDGDEISEYVRVNNVWVNCRDSSSYELVLMPAQSTIQLLLMVKPNTTVPSANPSPSESARRKQSAAQPFLPSFQKTDLLTLKLPLRQSAYKYYLQSTCSYIRKNGFEVRYFYCQELEQYAVSNVGNGAMRVRTEEGGEGEEWVVGVGEEVRLVEEMVAVTILPAIMSTDRDEKQAGICQQKKQSFLVQQSAMQIPQILSTKISLKSHIKKQLQKPPKLQTFTLTLSPQQSYRKFNPIPIFSSQTGKISILDPGRGFQLMGKTDGVVQRDAEGRLELWLVPVASGKLVLPRVLMDYRRGNWQGSIFVNVVE